MTSTFTNNQGIIEVARKLKIFDLEQMQLINTVRISLSLIFLSDLIYICSKRIKECLLAGERDDIESSYD